MSKDKRLEKSHPIQPVAFDGHGVIRFKPNAIVGFLLDDGPFDMNDLALKGFSREDHEQFAQLIGYSVSGFGDLSYASTEVVAIADEMAEKVCEEDEKEDELDEKDLRIAYLTEKLEKMTKHVKDLAVETFDIHPADLEELT